VRRELGAKNARVELGGDPPDDPATLWRDLSGGWRVVAVLEAPPENRQEQLARLDALVASFSGLTATTAHAEQPGVRVPVAVALSAALADLASRAGGTDAVVIDGTSPVLWGTSDVTRGLEEDVAAALEVAALDERARDVGVDIAPLLATDEGALGGALAQTGVSEGLAADLGREIRVMRRRAGSHNRDAVAWHRYLLVCRAIADTRALLAGAGAGSGASGSHAAHAAHGAHLRESVHEEGFGLLARAFANIYLLVIAFDGTFSELHAEAAMLHALPRIERLVLSLPPVDPLTGGPDRRAAQVVTLRPRARVRRA